MKDRAAKVRTSVKKSPTTTSRNSSRAGTDHHNHQTHHNYNHTGHGTTSTSTDGTSLTSRTGTSTSRTSQLSTTATSSATGTSKLRTRRPSTTGTSSTTKNKNNNNTKREDGHKSEVNSDQIKSTDNSIHTTIRPSTSSTTNACRKHRPNKQRDGSESDTCDGLSWKKSGSGSLERCRPQSHDHLNRRTDQ